MQMHTYIIWFILLTFHSVAVSAGLEEVLNVAQCVADIHQDLPDSYVSFMKSDGEKKVRKSLVFSLHDCGVFEKKNVLRFQVVKRCKLNCKYIIERIGYG